MPAICCAGLSLLHWNEPAALGVGATAFAGAVALQQSHGNLACQSSAFTSTGRLYNARAHHCGPNQHAPRPTMQGPPMPLPG